MLSSALREKVWVARTMPPPDTMRKIRLDARLTQTDIAQEVGCTTAAVSNWERGTRRPQGDLARRYVDVLREL